MRIKSQKTMWVVLVSTTTNIPIFVTVTHTELWIFPFFVISRSEQICKSGIKYAHSLTRDHMGSACVYHYPHTKFHHCSPYRTLDICLSCYKPIGTDMQMRNVICAFSHNRPSGWYLCPPLPTYQLSLPHPIQNSGYLPFLLLANQKQISK